MSHPNPPLDVATLRAVRKYVTAMRDQAAMPTLGQIEQWIDWQLAEAAAPRPVLDDRVLAEVGEWERAGGAWDVGRMASFIDLLIQYGTAKTHALATAPRPVAAQEQIVTRLTEWLDGKAPDDEAALIIDARDAIQQAHAALADERRSVAAQHAIIELFRAKPPHPRDDGECDWADGGHTKW